MQSIFKIAQATQINREFHLKEAATRAEKLSRQGKLSEEGV